MLIDQEDSYIFPLRCKPLERFLDCGIVRLAIDDQKVLLRVRWRSDVLSPSASIRYDFDSIERKHILRYLPTAVLLLNPA